MYVEIKNENYGYSVATYGDFVATGNPAITRYDPLSASTYRSGSVDIFKYNYSLDSHEYLGSLYKDFVLHDIILAEENGGVIGDPLYTEPSGSDIYSQNKGLLIDRDLYSNMLEDGYGISLDAYNKLLVIGCPYYLHQVDLSSSFNSTISGSGVDIFNLERYEKDLYNSELIINKPAALDDGTGSMAGFSRIYVSDSPNGYNFLDLQYAETGSSEYSTLSRKTISLNGGYNEFYINDNIISPLISGSFRFQYSIKPSSYITTLNNPDSPLTATSFGHSVSINSGWIAVGAPHVSGSEGMVYLYKNDMIGNEFSWSLQQKITSGDSTPGLLFGSSLELNKVTSSLSGSLIVGVGNASGSRAFLFEYISGSWTKTYTFTPQNTNQPLTFGNYVPFSEVFNESNGYGTAVSIYNTTVTIGSPTYRTVQEFSSSAEYEQGAVFVYERCFDSFPRQYELVLKTHGNENILKNNRLGYSVSAYSNAIIAGVPKTNVDSLSSCYIQSTLEQLHYCNPELENELSGQYILVTKNSNNSWELSKILQKKKKYLSPYRSFGYSVDIGDKSIVIGAPLNISDSQREINLSTTSSFDIELDDIAGKAYIYNLDNYKEDFHVGNVFYRNGKVILMTSGSVFDGLLFNPIRPFTYEYQIDFKGQHTIFEKQIICTVNPGEFNVSTNPTAINRTSTNWDINNNGIFDFQDLDVLLSYMQYKNTLVLSDIQTTTNWSASIVVNDDEKSLLKFYKENNNYFNTPQLISQSINRFEFVDTIFKSELDLNQDNKIDINDINIMWKYFSNRLTQENYTSYITPSSNRQLFSEILDYMDEKTNKKSIPLIKNEFFEYERRASLDNTGSYLAPYVTTVGLYDGLDLVAYAKLGSPIKITNEFPINFCIKMDF